MGETCEIQVAQRNDFYEKTKVFQLLWALLEHNLAKPCSVCFSQLDWLLAYLVEYQTTEQYPHVQFPVVKDSSLFVGEDKLRNL